MVNEEVLKPIKLFAYLYFLGFGILALAIPLTSSRADSNAHYFFIFCYIFSFFHFFFGIGVLARKKWGFYPFKCYLNLLTVAYPIGFIAKNMLEYIDKNNIEEFYSRKTLNIK